MTEQELEKFYRSSEEMFRTEGWKTLMSDLTEDAERINSIEACKDEKDLSFRKGQLSTIASLLNLQVHLETAQQQGEEDQEEPDNDE
jgi:hypothetical protein|tara:strand:- start:255 stop:515 length:261 start_codon:yes stop_codon:yes gene_type:complete